MYWSMPRSGSIPAAGAAAQVAITTATATRRARSIPLRQVLELLNHDLDVPGGRLGRRAVVTQVNADRFGAWHRQAGRKLAPRDNPTTDANSLEHGPIGFPAKPVRQVAGRLVEAIDVRRDVVRLHDVLHILVVRVAPAADFDVELAVILLRAELVPRQEAKRCRRIET